VPSRRAGLRRRDAAVGDAAARAGVPTLEAELYDGTGTITLIWLGRRRIGGIDCGRSMVARGRLTEHDGRPTIYNADYELRPSVA